MGHANFLVSSERMTRFVHHTDELFVFPEFEQLARDWYANWPEQLFWFEPSLWHARDRAVRFHWLPRSKVTPNTAAEDRTILRRLSAIIEAVAVDDPEVSVLLSSNGFTLRHAVPRRPDPLEPIERRLFSNATWFGSRRILSLAEHSGGEWESLWTATLDVHDPRLPSLANAISIDDSSPLFLTAGLRRMIKPYLGGFDVYLESRAARDALASRFSTWLSPQREWEPRSDEAPLASPAGGDPA